MELKEVAENIYACLQEDRGLGWNNAGFINLGGGVAVDTFYDLSHTKQMIELYKTVSQDPPLRLVNTHHNGDHVWGNQLFKDAEIIAHRLCAEYLEKEKENNLPALIQSGLENPEAFPPATRWFLNDIREFNFSGIEITLPNHLFDDRLDLDLDGKSCQLIYVGPAHTAGDIIIYLPDHSIVFAGDIIFNGCTPVGWEGTQAKWIEALDLIVSLNPKVIVPGHGPLCGVEEAKVFRSYLEFVFSEARRLFDDGIDDPLEASKRIELGSYSEWTEPERLVFNVNRAYREFRGTEPWDAPFNAIELIGKCYELRVHWEKG